MVFTLVSGSDRTMNNKASAASIYWRIHNIWHRGTGGITVGKALQDLRKAESLAPLGSVIQRRIIELRDDIIFNNQDTGAGADSGMGA